MKIMTDFIVLIFMYSMIFYPKWKVRGKNVLFVNTVMYIYLLFVLYFTLMPVIAALPFMFDHPYVPMNLVPFGDLTDGRGDFIRQVVLNVVMTVPFGFLFPLTQKSIGVSKQFFIHLY